MVRFIGTVGQPHRNFMKMASWSRASEHLVNSIGMSDQLKWNNQKVGRNGELNKELLINRRDKSKSLTWSSIVIALDKALNQKGNIISRPKEIGDIRGISYIYPIFYRLGLIDVPEHIADIMSLQ